MHNVILFFCVIVSIAIYTTIVAFIGNKLTYLPIEGEDDDQS